MNVFIVKNVYTNITRDSILTIFCTEFYAIQDRLAIQHGNSRSIMHEAQRVIHYAGNYTISMVNVL